MQWALSLIKRILPEMALKKIRPFGHGFLAYIGAVRYGFPSRKLVVIGVTGTAGKSTTVQMLAKILNDSKRKTGYVTTVDYFDGNTKHLNKHGMSMPGRFLLHEDMLTMIKNGCKYAVIEATSEGLAQNRHLGIDFDIAVIGNLSAAHLDSHGGFENYKKAKGRLFAALQRSKVKPFFQQKIIGVNLDDENYKYFGGFNAVKKFGITSKGLATDLVNDVFSAEQVTEKNGYWSFKLDGQSFELSLPGEFNIYNAMMAVAVAREIGVSLQQCAESVSSFKQIAGRMEQIQNNRGIKIFLDYAPEPVAMESALKAVQHMNEGRLIHVFGSTGGHRDVAKRFEFGEISAKLADVIVITNDDVYDSDPQKIAEDIREGIGKAEHKKVAEVITVLDRAEAIRKAIDIAKKNDTILITGKGSEQFLVLPNNQRIEWDEKKVIEAAL